MIELLATSPDGWALVRFEGDPWLLRPPYEVRNMYRLGEGQLRRALAEEDFVGAQGIFKSWGGVARYLEDQRAAQATPEEREEARGAAERILARSTAAQAQQHLDSIRDALNVGHDQGVERALRALLRAPEVQRTPDLVGEISQLLDRASRGQPSQKGVMAGQRMWLVESEPSVEEKNRTIAQQGSTLPLGLSAAA